MSTTNAKGKPLQRKCALRFPSSTPKEFVDAQVAAWNERFATYFRGVGFFDPEPEVEMFTQDGSVVAVETHHLYADSTFWREVSASRTFHIAQPVMEGVAA